MLVINEVQLLCFCRMDQAITLIRGCCGDSNQYTPCKGKPDNMMYAQSLGPYVRLLFAKSLQGQNHSSTLGMKSWFHSNRPTISIVLGYLILPPRTTIE
jgi:hypothetical protein